MYNHLQYQLEWGNLVEGVGSCNITAVIRNSENMTYSNMKFEIAFRLFFVFYVSVIFLVSQKTKNIQCLINYFSAAVKLNFKQKKKSYLVDFFVDCLFDDPLISNKQLILNFIEYFFKQLNYLTSLKANQIVNIFSWSNKLTKKFNNQRLNQLGK